MLSTLFFLTQVPLHYAAASAHGAMCLELLVNKGANTNMKVKYCNNHLTTLPKCISCNFAIAEWSAVNIVFTEFVYLITFYLVSSGFPL